MSEKFSNFVNWPHRATAKLRDKIAAKLPTSGVGKAVQATGVLSASMAQFLLWLSKYITLDNHATRAMEHGFEKINVGTNSKGKPKKFSSFIKKYPNLSSHVIYYMLMSGIIMGGKAWLNASDGATDEQKEKTENVQPPVQENECWADIRINPQSADYDNQCRKLENVIMAALIYTETYRDIPKVQTGENVWTHGYGLTWSPSATGHMSVRDYAVEKVKGQGVTPHKPVVERTKQGDILESKQFLRDKVYPEIQRYLSKEIDAKTFIALCVAGYQMTGHIEGVCERINNATTDQQLADAFMSETMWNYGGTAKRRWVCAMIATGCITMNDVLDAYIDGFYALGELDCFTKKEKTIDGQHFIMTEDFVKTGLAAKQHGKDKIVRQELVDTECGQIALAEIETGMLHGEVQDLIDEMIKHHKDNHNTRDDAIIKKKSSGKTKSKKTDKRGKKKYNKSKRTAFASGVNKVKKNAFMKGLTQFNDQRNLG